MTIDAPRPPALIVIGGLPATGKSTIAAALTRAVGAAYVRVDTIEQAMRHAQGADRPLGPAGYVVAYAVAGEQLRHGATVVAESVNPLAVTRDAWRRTGLDVGAHVVEVEVFCSDAAEHRRRAETRTVDVQGLVLPTWQQIVDREYEPWQREPLRLDTAVRSVEECVQVVVAAVDLASDTRTEGRS